MREREREREEERDLSKHAGANVYRRDRRTCWPEGL